MLLKKSSTKSSGAKATGKRQAEAAILGDTIGRKVVVAFDGDGGQWRTTGGIARQTGLPRKTVEDYIQKNQQCFVRSRISLGGKALYAIRTGLRKKPQRRG